MAEYKRPDDFERDAYKNWKLAVDTNQAQLDREIEDLKWQVAENQWDSSDRTARGASSVQGIQIAARPCLSIPKIKQPMSIVDAQFRSAHLSVSINPISDDANDETAEIYQDEYRAMERRSNAAQARWWAFDRAKQCGRGYYRLNTQYVPLGQSDDPFDQEVVIERILYQSAVVMDPAATKADCSDAEWAFITAWLPFDVFKRKWPKAKLTKDSVASGTKLTLESLSDQTPEWANDGDRKSVQVGEYWYKHYETETVTSLDGTRTREAEKCVIRWCVFGPGGDDGLDVLEEQEWNGDEIPLIPAYWSELQPFDEQRRYEGMVRPARDGGKLYNFMASEAVSVIGSLPKAPWIGDVRQFEPYMEAWKQSNTRIFPFLPIAAVLEGGTLLPPPQRVQSDASGLQPLMIMLQQADEFIQSSTATPDSVLGRRNPRAESGRAIQALQGQSEAANSSGIQNFSDVTLMYEAKVAIGMMKRVLDRPGRVLHVLNPQGEIRPVMINAPFTTDSKGRPQRAGVPPAGQTTTQQPQANVKHYDLSKGYYGVSVRVGKSYNTQREQGAELLASIMERDPELGTVLAPLLLNAMDGPYMQEAAELAKEYRDQKFPGLGQSKDGVETPEQLQAKLKAAEAQIKQMGQQLQQAAQAIETKQAEQMAKIEAEKIKAMSDAQQAQMKAQTDQMSIQAEGALKLRLEEIEVQAAERLEMMRQDAENARQEGEQRFDLAMKRMEQMFEAHEAEKDRQQAQQLAVHAAEQAEVAAEREAREPKEPE